MYFEGDENVRKRFQYMRDCEIPLGKLEIKTNIKSEKELAKHLTHWLNYILQNEQKFSHEANKISLELNLGEKNQ